MSYFTKIRPLGAGLFATCGQTNGETEGLMDRLAGGPADGRRKRLEDTNRLFSQYHHCALVNICI
jgi:hypothetical protein